MLVEMVAMTNMRVRLTMMRSCNTNITNGRGSAVCNQDVKSLHGVGLQVGLQA